MDRNEYIQAGTGILNVALRKESVDRNTDPINLSDIPAKSLSARRAWIEMMFWLFLQSWSLVALRKESVDRNTIRSSGRNTLNSRSPQGERG